MANNSLVSTEFSGGVLTITLLRAQNRNALSRQLIEDIQIAFRHWSERKDLAVAVLTGEGEKAFCAGGDLRELMTLRSAVKATEFAANTREALNHIRRFPVPVLAVLNGDALGGGAELAIACDIRLAFAHARIGFVQSSLNINTSWGGGTDLFRLVPHSKAMHLLCTAEVISAAQALQLGLIDAVAPTGGEGLDFIRSYVAKFARRKPQVMRAIKALSILNRFDASHAEWEKVETERFSQTWVHEDHWAAVADLALGKK